MSENRDSLDELLAAPPLPTDAEKLRHLILTRSTGVVRRRRQLKQLAWVGSLAACFCAGMVTMHYLTPAPAAQVVVNQPELKQAVPSPKRETPSAPLAAVAVENEALDSTDNRAELYRTAAELYRQEGDLASWVRCKDNALDTGKKEDLTVSADDDFLTIALKQDRQKQEKRNARHLD